MQFHSYVNIYYLHFIFHESKVLTKKKKKTYERKPHGSKKNLKIRIIATLCIQRAARVDKNL